MPRLQDWRWRYRRYRWVPTKQMSPGRIRTCNTIIITSATLCFAHCDSTGPSTALLSLSLPRSRCLIHVNDLSYCRSIFKSLSKHCRSCVGTVPIPRQERFAILPNLCRTLRHVFGRVPSASTYPAPLAITLAMAVTLPMVTDTTYGNNP